jgi:hypothetical protein
MQMKNMAGHLYLLYAITTSGFAYLIKLKSPAAYKSGSVLASSELIQLDISKNLVRLEQITAVTAAAGILCIGGQNGSILCHQLGQLDVNAQGILYIYGANVFPCLFSFWSCFNLLLLWLNIQLYTSFL